MAQKPSTTWTFTSYQKTYPTNPLTGDAHSIIGDTHGLYVGGSMQAGTDTAQSYFAAVEMKYSDGTNINPPYYHSFGFGAGGGGQGTDSICLDGGWSTSSYVYFGSNGGDPGSVKDRIERLQKSNWSEIYDEFSSSTYGGPLVLGFGRTAPPATSIC